MQKNIQQIRNIEVIEKELNTCPVGVLALIVEEKIVQVATTFLYLDKNIYIFLDDNSELYQSIHFESNASFILIKNEKVRKHSKADYSPSYHSIAIKISGNIRKVEEQKVIDEVQSGYLNKYSKDNLIDETGVPGKAIIIDTEEIQALEESGG